MTRTQQIPNLPPFHLTGCGSPSFSRQISPSGIASSEEEVRFRFSQLHAFCSKVVSAKSYGERMAVMDEYEAATAQQHLVDYALSLDESGREYNTKLQELHPQRLEILCGKNLKEEVAKAGKSPAQIQDESCRVQLGQKYVQLSLLQIRGKLDAESLERLAKEFAAIRKENCSTDAGELAALMEKAQKEARLIGKDWFIDLMTAGPKEGKKKSLAEAQTLLANQAFQQLWEEAMVDGALHHAEYAFYLFKIMVAEHVPRNDLTYELVLRILQATDAPLSKVLDIFKTVRDDMVLGEGVHSYRVYELYRAVVFGDRPRENSAELFSMVEQPSQRVISEEDAHLLASGKGLPPGTHDDPIKHRIQTMNFATRKGAPVLDATYRNTIALFKENLEKEMLTDENKAQYRKAQTFQAEN